MNKAISRVGGHSGGDGGRMHVARVGGESLRLRPRRQEGRSSDTAAYSRKPREARDTDSEGGGTAGHRDGADRRAGGRRTSRWWAGLSSRPWTRPRPTPARGFGGFAQAGCGGLAQGRRQAAFARSGGPQRSFAGTRKRQTQRQAASSQRLRSSSQHASIGHPLRHLASRGCS